MIAPQDELYQPSSPDNTYGFRKCCEAIGDVVSIEERARRYTTLKPLWGRAWFTGPCPLRDHEDRDPSFYLYPDGWHCYGCGRGGDVVDLEFHCGDYGELWEAMIALSLEYGVELPKRGVLERRLAHGDEPAAGADREGGVCLRRRQELHQLPGRRLLSL